MAGSNSIPPSVDAKAADLLKRAYDLQSDEDTRSLYGDWADTYDDTLVRGLGYLSPRTIAELLAGAMTGRDEPVLDVGCGTGLAGSHLAGHGFACIDGIDYSAEMLRVAKDTGHYRNLMELDLTRPLPLQDGTYAGALCTGTFTHGHVGPGCLAELFRVLRPGGLFAFSVNTGVWSDLGFDVELKRLEENGTARLIERKSGKNFETSETLDSWLNLYERR